MIDAIVERKDGGPSQAVLHEMRIVGDLIHRLHRLAKPTLAVVDGSPSDPSSPAISRSRATAPASARSSSNAASRSTAAPPGRCRA